MAQAPRRLSIADVLGFGSAPQRNLTQGYRQAVNRPATGTIKPDRKTFSRKIGEALTPNTRAGNEYANKIASLLDMITMTGSEEPLVQARGAAGRGDYGRAAFEGALGILSAIPGAGKVGSKVAREAAEAAAERGIIAYHGSPHSFDRFDMSKIGTGEGAQSYGHGLYFAEAEDVAKSYRDALTDPGNIPLHINNKPVDEVWVDGLRQKFPEMYKGLTRSSAEDMDTLLGTISQVSELGDIGSALSSLGSKRYTDLYRSRVAPFIGKPEVGPGSMYQVRINANPEDFIDWDTPISGQSEKVKDALDYAGILRKVAGVESEIDTLRNVAKNQGFSPTEQQKKAMSDLAKRRFNLMQQSGQLFAPRTPSEASKLSQMGISGVKYLDQASRQIGEGSRNYVVFDDALIDILKKYGIAIPAIAGGGLLASQPQQDGGI